MLCSHAVSWGRRQCRLVHYNAAKDADVRDQQLHSSHRVNSIKAKWVRRIIACISSTSANGSSTITVFMARFSQSYGFMTSDVREADCSCYLSNAYTQVRVAFVSWEEKAKDECCLLIRILSVDDPVVKSGVCPH